MAGKRDKPEEIVMKLRQVEVFVSQRAPVADAVRQFCVTKEICCLRRQEHGRLNLGWVKRLMELEFDFTWLRKATHGRLIFLCLICARTRQPAARSRCN
jgi:putative transposase